MSRNLLTMVLAVLGMSALACAHSQAAAPPVSPISSAPPTPQVTNTQPAEPPRQSDESDLAAMLRGDALHFAFDKADLTDDSQQRLRNIAQILQSHPHFSLRIEGNCDERGTEEYNLQLGQQRANTARNYLDNLGIDGSRIATISYGKDRPLDPHHNSQAWAANRRDDIKPSASRSATN